jgi:predicted RNA-binding protein with PIN domain
MAGADSSLPPYVLVDGHSVIFAWDDLREIHAGSGLAAREELCRRLTTYQDVTGERVVLVFDGQGDRPQAAGAQGDDEDAIQVFYSSAGSTADQLIERLAGRYSDSRRITVASNDRAVLDTSSSFGADAISATAFRDLVDGAEAELRRRIDGRSR